MNRKSVFSFCVNSLILAGCVALSGCALPASDKNIQSFVPQVDLEVVSLTREGLHYYTRGRYVDAEFKFLEALELTPKVDSIEFNLALTYIEEGAFRKAEEILLRLLADKPDSTMVMAALARLAMEEKDFSKSINYYQQALEVALKWKELERATNFARSISVLQFLQGNENEALASSTLAYSLLETPEEMCKHSKFLIASGRLSEAWQGILGFITDKEVKKDPCLTSNLALIAFAQGAYEDVIKYCEMVLNYRKVDLDFVNLVKLLQYLSEKRLAEQKATEDVQTTTEITTANSEEDTQDLENNPFESYRDGEPTETNFALYWPVQMLEPVMTEALEFKEEE